MASFTHLSLAGHEDSAPRFGMGDVLEARFATRAVGGTVLGLSHQRLRPGARLPFGHRHERQEELYVVLAGSGTANVEGTLVPLEALDVLRVDPAATRSFEAGPDGLEYLVVGAPVAGEPDTVITQGWWPGDG